MPVPELEQVAHRVERAGPPGHAPQRQNMPGVVGRPRCSVATASLMLAEAEAGRLRQRPLAIVQLPYRVCRVTPVRHGVLLPLGTAVLVETVLLLQPH